MNAHHKFLSRAALMLAATLAVSAGGAGLAGPAGAEQDLIYGFTATGSAIETFANIPHEIQQGTPSGTVFLENPDNPFCEGIAGVYDLGLIIDDFAEITVPSYKNPTRMRVHNPEGSFKSKAEYSTFPGGPAAVAHCDRPDNGVSRATWGGGGNEQGMVQSAFAETKASRTQGKQEVVTESIGRVQGVKLGEAGFRLIESYLKVVFTPDAEPVITYRLTMGGFFNGDEVMGSFGEPGLTIAGQAVGGEDFLKQFNEQSKAHEKDLEVFGKYGFRLLQPRHFVDGIQGRDTIQMACVEGSLGLTPRKSQVGDNQGIRFGLTRVGGRIVSRG